MNQSKLESFIETMLNISSGFILSMVVWQFIVAPLYNIPVDIKSNIGITTIFTVVSIVRGYYWRRFFAVGVHVKIKSFIGKLYQS